MVLRIFKMIATGGFLAGLECTKFVVGKERKGEEGNGRHRTPFSNSWIPPDKRIKCFSINYTQWPIEM